MKTDKDTFKILEELLFILVTKKADAKYHGNLTILKSKGGWKVVFGTPPSIKNEVPILQAIDDNLCLRDALHLAIIQDPKVGGAQT